MASMLLIFSYVLDWLVIVVLAVVGGVLNNVTPNLRPFSLTDRDISFPFTFHETIPTWLLLVVALVIPVVLILVVTFVFVPGQTVPDGTPKSLIWRRKLWELHVGWLGLGLSMASTWFVTNGMKNLFGKARPDLLARCAPNLGATTQYVVGGFSDTLQNGQLVSADICTSTDKATLDDGFRSFPSGHASTSAAGLLYLSLFLASKLAVTIPIFSAPSSSDSSIYSAFPSRIPRDSSKAEQPLPGEEILPATAAADRNASRVIASARRQAAAPPLYLLVAVLIPSFAAIFIASSRYFDYRHHGFDILSGSLIGIAAAIISFRYYHLPISRGAGWAWGPRNVDKALWAGIGSHSYATSKDASAYPRVKRVDVIE